MNTTTAVLYAAVQESKAWDFPPTSPVETITFAKPVASRLAAEAMAMVAVVEALSGLTPESRQRVAEWLLREVEREDQCAQ